MSEKGLTKPETVFRQVARRLRAHPWFKKEGWLCSVHPFPSDAPEAITFHVYKDHWFNEERQGIHIESFLMLDPKKRSKSSVTVHLLHEEFIPGTKIPRKEIAKSFMETVEPKIAKWKGYEFRAGRLSRQPFAKTLDGTEPDFADLLAKEIERLCPVIGPAVDHAVRSAIFRRGLALG